MRKVKLFIKGCKALAFIMFFISISACSQELDEVDNELPQDNFNEISYPIVSTNQTTFFSNYDIISEPEKGDDFYGQDANYTSNTPSYTDNGDGTITDNITGLMWQKSPGSKLTWNEADNAVDTFSLAGYNDWRLPTIKELYSLIQFNGIDPSGLTGVNESELVPFIDDTYFDFSYGNESDGERIIDAQFATSTLYVGNSQFGGGNLMFGVNFADGRIKGYPSTSAWSNSPAKTFFVLYVRGTTEYGINKFTDNGDSTITDEATGLMWMKYDSKKAVNWKEALAYSESLQCAGYDDWRLPDAKELQSILDYSKCPDIDNSAAINDLFYCTSIMNENNEIDYGYYWSSTTHESSSYSPGANAAYLSFGRALGFFNYEWMDVHGAGAQRSDPKVGSASDYPYGHGPQGDAIRCMNYVRCVRNLN